MTTDEALKRVIIATEANANFTEAILRLQDDSRLCFCHRVDERWAKSVGSEECKHDGGIAGEFLSAIKTFRLNRKHLDIQFEDGSRWDQALQEFQGGDHSSMISPS